MIEVLILAIYLSAVILSLGIILWRALVRSSCLQLSDECQDRPQTEPIGTETRV